MTESEYVIAGIFAGFGARLGWAFAQATLNVVVQLTVRLMRPFIALRLRRQFGKGMEAVRRAAEKNARAASKRKPKSRERRH